ncbi:apoptosis-inducing factor homolog a [Phtheirospermum japonicum]|uniref:Apoptosis-inducing factor homolog a n=1 Tax=Phtheirospermum japonicum TaxID=374723 RepID=A0A830CBK3_9LAMI|nr:apoptosis-inducing factor homolog a [Phtheirospermum japonicum]
MERLVGEKKTVVVVGGGAAGSLIAKTLQDNADVFLIDPKEFSEITWASLRSMVEPSFAERSVINHSDYLPNALVIRSMATDITRNEVLTAQGRRIAYDYLVIATGHVDSGAYTKAEKLSHYQAEHGKIKSAQSILIVGGGPYGVELAAEIITDFPDKKVTLVHRGSRLLEFIGEKAGIKALDWLTTKNVEVILGQSVNLNSVSDGVYETSGGERIIADCHFRCTVSPIGSSWLKETFWEDKLDSHGRLVVDEKLRVKGHDNIFAIGDITDIPELKLGYLAHAHAVVAAKNVKLLMKGESESKLYSYKAASPLAIVSLGRREGVAQVICLTIAGRIPGMIKSGTCLWGKQGRHLVSMPTSMTNLGKKFCFALLRTRIANVMFERPEKSSLKMSKVMLKS